MIRLGVDSVRIKDRSRAWRQFKYAADNSFLLTMANHIWRRFPSQQQRKRVNQDGFPGSGLTCQKVEAKPERGDRTVDHSVVFRAQLQQHKGLRQRRIARIANLAGISSGTILYTRKSPHHG